MSPAGMEFYTQNNQFSRQIQVKRDFYVKLRHFYVISGNKTEVPQGCSGKIRWVFFFSLVNYSNFRTKNQIIQEKIWTPRRNETQKAPKITSCFSICHCFHNFLETHKTQLCTHTHARTYVRVRMCS